MMYSEVGKWSVMCRLATATRELSWPKRPWFSFRAQIYADVYKGSNSISLYKVFENHPAGGLISFFFSGLGNMIQLVDLVS